MKKLLTLPLALVCLFALPWLGIVAYSYFNFGFMQPVTDPLTGTRLPPQRSGMEIAGERVYAANGCVACHTQDVRPADAAAGIGPRRMVARDYMYDQPAFPGALLIGPDLSNVGMRHPDANWLHRHLYEPQSLIAGSCCPSFRFLYAVKKISGQRSAEAIDGLANAPGAGMEVLPSAEARDLVRYLLSLRLDYNLPEAPAPAK